MIKKLLITILLLISPTLVFAQDECTWKVTSVEPDHIRGSIIVRTDYFLDGYLVHKGTTRYDEQSGTPLQVSKLIGSDVEQQCHFLLKTDKIPDRFYKKPEVVKKKQDTKLLLKKLKRIEGKKGKVLK